MIPSKTFWLRAFKKWLFLVFSAKFQNEKSTLPSPNYVVLVIYWIRRTFYPTILSFSIISKHDLSNKDVANFLWLSLQDIEYPFMMYICMQKSVEFHWLHYKYLQLSSHLYEWPSKNSENGTKHDCKIGFDCKLFTCWRRLRCDVTIASSYHTD